MIKNKDTSFRWTTTDHSLVPFTKLIIVFLLINNWPKESLLTSAVVCNPLRDQFNLFCFYKVAGWMYEHQYIISIFELSYYERTLMWTTKYFVHSQKMDSTNTVIHDFLDAPFLINFCRNYNLSPPCVTFSN